MNIPNLNPRDKIITLLTNTINVILSTFLPIYLKEVTISTLPTTIQTSLPIVRGYIVVKSNTDIRIWMSAIQSSDSSQIVLQANTSDVVTLLLF